MILGKKIEVMKFVDHWMGAPICLFLGVFHRITHPFYRTWLNPPLKRAPKTILVMKFFGLGSIILASSLLKSIKIKYPDAQIIFLTFKSNSDLIHRLRLCDLVRTVDTRNLLTLFFSILSNLAFFVFHRPDICIDLEYYSKFSTIISYLSGAKWRVGFYIARFWRNSLVNVRIYFNHARHILEIYSMVGASIGVRVREPLPTSIPVSTEEYRSIDRLFVRNRFQKEDLLLGVNVNASDLAHCRKWPKSNFAQVMSELLRENKRLKIILTGSRTERRYTASVLKLLEEDVKSRVFDFSGALSFGEFIAVLGRIRLLLTNDSGPFHLAKAQGVPTVSIWGPGSPDLYGPYKEEKERHKVVYKRWTCSPCLYIYRTDAGHFCGKTAPCLSEISSQEVVKLVREAMHDLAKERSRQER